MRPLRPRNPNEPTEHPTGGVAGVPVGPERRATPLPNLGPGPDSPDALAPELIGENVLFTGTRRDGRRFTLSVPLRGNGVEILVHLMDMLWNTEPVLARAVLDHLNESAKP